MNFNVRLIAAIFACLGSASGASAQDAAANRWSGFYIGADAGGGQAKIEDSSISFPGAAIGGHIGYNWQSSHVVFGFEGDLSWTNYGYSETFNFPGGSLSVDAGHDYFASVRGKLGFTEGPLMFYGTFGVAFTEYKVELEVTAPAIDVTANESVDLSGVIGGFGLEYALGPNVSLRGEAMWYELHPDFDFSSTAYNGNIFRAGLSYQFR